MNAQLQEKEVNQVVEYGVTDAALAQLKEKFEEVPDASTKEGYELIKAGLKEISPLRIGIEKKRVKLKAESLAWGKKVDAEAKRITSEITALEDPYKEAKKLQDDKEEREKQEAIEKEQARISGIESKIFNIKSFSDGLLGVKASYIRERLDKLEDLEINEANYQEFLEPAEIAFKSTHELLTKTHAEREAFETQQAQQAEQQRIMDEKQAELDAKQAVIDAQEAAQKQKERDEQIAKEAEERATKAAELKIKQELEAAAQREIELKERAELAERETKEKEQQLLRDLESQRKRELEEAEAREKDRKHKAAINNAAIDALVAGGMNKTNAKQAVTLIAKRLIPNVAISY